MWIRESDRSVQYNWIAIFSYTASLAVSLAIWKGLIPSRAITGEIRRELQCALRS